MNRFFDICARSIALAFTFHAAQSDGDPNRFFNIRGDVCTQLAPWTLREMGLSAKKAVFESREPIRFRSDLLGGVVEVSAGYISDLASIPQFAWSLFMACDDPRIELGAWIHDLLYQSRGAIWIEGKLVRYSRAIADRVLAYEAMPALGANRLQCWLVYQALRRFGDQWPEQTFMERLQG